MRAIHRQSEKMTIKMLDFIIMYGPTHDFLPLRKDLCGGPRGWILTHTLGASSPPSLSKGSLNPMRVWLHTRCTRVSSKRRASSRRRTSPSCNRGIGSDAPLSVSSGRMLNCCSLNRTCKSEHSNATNKHSINRSPEPYLEKHVRKRYLKETHY